MSSIKSQNFKAQIKREIIGNDSASLPSSSHHQPYSNFTTANWRKRRLTAENDDYRKRKLRMRSENWDTTTSKDINNIDDVFKQIDEHRIQQRDRQHRALADIGRYKETHRRNSQENESNSQTLRARGSLKPSLVSSLKMEQDEEESSSTNKENIKPKRSKKSSGKRRSLNSKTEIEDNPDILIRRQKDIDYGKNQPVYDEYLKNVSKEMRSNQQPWTPDKYERMTRRNWDKQVKVWRKQLHHWKDPKTTEELFGFK